MFENRKLGRDLAAVALLALVAFLAVSLATYSPADPVVEPPAPLDSLYRPDQLVWPQHAAPVNACGWLGALAADLLLSSLGVGAWYVVVSLAVFDYLLLRRREVNMPLLRALGWLLSLLGLTAAASIAIGDFSLGPVVGSGGYAGAIAGGLLSMHFAAAGALILAGAALLVGLFLSTDYTLLKMLRPAAIAAAAVPRAARKLASCRRPKNEAPKSAGHAIDAEVDADEDEDEEALFETDEEVAVRIRGKRVDDLAAREAVAAAAERVDNPSDDGAEQIEAEPESEGDEPEDSAAEPVVKRRRKRSAAAGRAAAPHFLKRKSGEEARQEVREKLDEAAFDEDELLDYDLPALDLLLEGDEISYDAQETEVRRKAKILEKTFAEFGFQVKVVEIETGPVIAQYEVQLEAGLRLSKITGLAEDLAIALRVPSVRIVAPIPGKNTVGIEVPNEQRQIVRLREVMEESVEKTKKMRIPLFLGKDVSGNPLIVDLSTLPHLLIAGRTGTGKSVCLNAIISSMLMTRRPDEVRMLMIDPKMVELSGYGRLPHLMHPVVTDMRKAEAILAWAVDKMEERYALLAKAGVRHISSYNQLGKDELLRRLGVEDEAEAETVPTQLPFIVIVADEMADLMMTSGKEVEQHIIRLAQKSRAVGIHLILATQKPTVDVITGLIKSNLPARIAFQVASRTDSRVVLDEMGADKLLGNGDMLFLWPGTSTLLRGQGTYLSDDEIERVTEFVSRTEQSFVGELVNLKVDGEEGGKLAELKKRDDLYESAVDIVVREGRGSVSLLQRALGIGYGRAARLIDFMEEDGIVGEYAGSQAREVTISIADWERLQKGEPEEEQPAAAPKSRRSNKIKPAAPPPADEDDADDGAPWDEEQSAYEEDDDADYEEEEAEEDEDGDWEEEYEEEYEAESA